MLRSHTSNGSSIDVDELGCETKMVPSDSSMDPEAVRLSARGGSCVVQS